MNKIIALTGLCGAGKTTAALIIQEQGYQYLRFGQIVMDVLQQDNIPITPENEKKVRHALRQKHGMGAFAIANLAKLSAMCNGGKVVIDGLYSFAEYKVLKERFLDSFYTLAIFSPPEMRYKRLEERYIKTEDQHTLFRPLTRKEAIQRDYDEIENADKGGPIAMADWTILNTTSLKHFEKEVREFLCQM
jgi:dephospho-CoA kinase